VVKAKEPNKRSQGGKLPKCTRKHTKKKRTTLEEERSKRKLKSSSGG